MEQSTVDISCHAPCKQHIQHYVAVVICSLGFLEETQQLMSVSYCPLSYVTSALTEINERLVIGYIHQKHFIWNASTMDAYKLLESLQFMQHVFLAQHRIGYVAHDI